jgi:uncharacterized damage-inducible protein DinB
MEIKTIESFLSYYDRVRETTNRTIQAIPSDKMDWTYMPGKFTFADLVRHIAAIERNLFAESVSGNPICYTGCGKELADGYENVIAYYNEMHQQSMQIFNSLNDRDLKRKIISLNGKETEIGSMLKALIVHEIHHRAAMCIYLNMVNVKSPPLFGLTEEQVIQKSTSLLAKSKN